MSRIISSAPTASPSTLPSLQSFASVRTASLIPTALEGIATGDEFIKRLPEFDNDFANLRKEAGGENKVLRFVGVVDVAGGQVRAGLEKCVVLWSYRSNQLIDLFFFDRYPIDHPFATSLGGSDNIVMFHTERYSPRPLIVQGAGAGAAVTAMGVLGDLLKLV